MEHYLSSLFVTIKITITYFSENIALGKPAWQQYPLSPTRYGAGQAVDGLKTDLSLNGGQCTLSANFKQTAEWRVDLGGVRSINEIHIYYMTNNSPWGMYLQNSSKALIRPMTSYELERTLINEHESIKKVSIKHTNNNETKMIWK